ncbi:hypothetical protein EDD16DRAFT_647255 [Pisolithus croceorrhizus]|nr:hypothetical protein EDD16DRAFT_647255 [Pisolithus croceorrhizus]KAI6149051.1 hypothetical protein EDD17DRAFT_1216019 [Pisolithus thermaeus]
MDVLSISQLLDVLENYQTIRFLQAAPATFMVYDCVLYFDDEINYVWKKRLSSISVAYLIFRYLGIVYMMFSLGEFVSNTNSISEAIANAFPILSMCMNCLSVWFVQVVLGLRLYALYNGSKRVLLVIGLGFIAESVVMIVCVTLLSLPSDRYLLDLESNISAFPSAARKVYVNYGTIVVYEVILFSLALSAAIRRYREKPGPRPAYQSGAQRLRDILIEGNVVYFLANTLYAVFYFVVSLTLPSVWLFGVLTIGFALTSTIGCRLILHIRSAAPHPSTSPDRTDDETRLVPQPWPSKVHPSSSIA